MAKQGKVLPARRQRDRGEPSVLLRSAESLGRVIGLLQRQLDNASTRIDGKANRAGIDGHDVRRRKPAARSARASASNDSARTSSRADGSAATARKSKRAAKSAAGKKAASKKAAGKKK